MRREQLIAYHHSNMIEKYKKILLLLPPQRPPLCVHTSLSHRYLLFIYFVWRYQSAVCVWFSSFESETTLFFIEPRLLSPYLSFIDNKTSEHEKKKVVLNLIFSKLYFETLFFSLLDFIFHLCDKSRVRWMQNGCWWSIRIMLFTRIQSCVGMKWFFSLSSSMWWRW